MKITRRQLKKLIKEVIEAGPHGVTSFPPGDRSPRITTGRRTKDRFHGTAPKKELVPWEELTGKEYQGLQNLLQHEDESFKEVGYDVSDSALKMMSGTTKAAFEDEEYSRKRQRIYKQGVGVRSRIPPHDKFKVSVVIPYELIDLVIDAWEAWQQNPAKDSKFREAVNIYYDYVEDQLSNDVSSSWYDDTTGHLELEKALLDAGEIL